MQWKPCFSTWSRKISFSKGLPGIIISPQNRLNWLPAIQEGRPLGLRREGLSGHGRQRELITSLLLCPVILRRGGIQPSKSLVVKRTFRGRRELLSWTRVSFVRHQQPSKKRVITPCWGGRVTFEEVLYLRAWQWALSASVITIWLMAGLIFSASEEKCKMSLTF